MRKLFILIILLMLAGCVTNNQNQPSDPVEQEEPTDQPIPNNNVSQQPYTEVLDDTYYLILNGHRPIDDSQPQQGVREKIVNRTRQEALESIGYTLIDLNGDEVDELLVGIDDYEDKTTILLAYTLVDTKPQLIFESTSSNSYYMMANNRFFYRGTNIFDSGFGTFVLNEDATSLVNEEFTFMHLNDESPEYYKNTSASWNPSDSEKLDIQNEEFLSLDQELYQEVIKVVLTEFVSYEPVETYPISDEVPIILSFETADSPSNYDEFIVDDGQNNQTAIFITTNSTVKEFKVLQLELEDFDETGEIEFKTSELLPMDELIPERALLLRIPFMGTIPNYGISFVDSIGQERYFILQESGRDGSLLLSEFWK